MDFGNLPELYLGHFPQLLNSPRAFYITTPQIKLILIENSSVIDR